MPLLFYIAKRTIPNVATSTFVFQLMNLLVEAKGRQLITPRITGRGSPEALLLVI